MKQWFALYVFPCTCVFALMMLMLFFKVVCACEQIFYEPDFMFLQYMDEAGHWKDGLSDAGPTSVHGTVIMGM